MAKIRERYPSINFRIPHELLIEVERERLRRGMGRSSFVREAIRKMIAKKVID